jgi:hypothetical protein
MRYNRFAKYQQGTGVDENPQCLKCSMPLENLEGFFELHPEKR